MALDIKIRRRKKYVPVPGDIFLSDDNKRYLLAIDSSGEKLVISLDTWIASTTDGINPAASLDAILILTEED